MTMIYTARVEAIGERIEEEVTLQIGGIHLLCFASSCPYPIEVGGRYPVELSLFTIDDLEVMDVAPTAASIERIGEGFAYLLTGTLSGDTLDAGLIFQDPMFNINYAWLSGRTVQVRADRIDAAFLPIDGPVSV